MGNNVASSRIVLEGPDAGALLLNRGHDRRVGHAEHTREFRVRRLASQPQLLPSLPQRQPDAPPQQHILDAAIPRRRASRATSERPHRPIRRAILHARSCERARQAWRRTTHCTPAPGIDDQLCGYRVRVARGLVHVNLRMNAAGRSRTGWSRRSSGPSTFGRSDRTSRCPCPGACHRPRRRSTTSHGLLPAATSST